MLDWFTLIAQLVNFLVLVWLLKRFLYKPILNTIDEREKRIVNQINEAEAKKAEALSELDLYQRKNSEFDKQSQTLLNNATNDATTERQRLLAEARKEAENLRSQFIQALTAEQESFGAQIRHRTQSEVFAIVRKTLSDLAAVNLEEQMTIVFIDRLKNMALAEKSLLLSALKTNSNQLQIRTYNEIPFKQQQVIQNAIQSNFAIEPTIKFETSPHLISGIELVAGGYKISWNIDSYISSLEDSINKLLKEKSQASIQIQP